MDLIRISALRVEAEVGIHAWERGWRRPLILDLELALDLAPAGRSDRIEDTLDYAAVAELATELAASQHYALIERYAEALAQRLLQIERVASVTLEVGKPGAVPAARTVSVRITRP
jgi:dihydroneopterin aldolase